ncbi:MAG: extracellular solute-binding protein [Treponema sp.]|jgi:ABC-type glycerol-3-phosphate transport system substrate-binding protein|nr:extracellular solute-binding protein [Treponema sp.]
MLKQTIRLGMFLVASALISAVSVWASGGSDILKTKSFVYGNFWEDWSVDTYKPLDETGELLLEWRRKIQKDNGFTMREKMVSDYTNMLQTVTASIMAGRPAANVLVMEAGWAMALYRQKLLFPISDSKAVDITTSSPIAYRQIGWNQDVAKLFTFNGKVYAIWDGYGSSRHAAGMYYNKRLFREAGFDPDLPYNMQKAGTWTWDNYMDICKKLTRDRNNTGVIDTYAMTSDITVQILDAFVASNGAYFVDKDASGKFVNATGRPEFIEALQFCRRLLAEGVMMLRPEGSNWDWHFPMFHDGRVAIMVGADSQRDSLGTMADDWGWVLPPKGPRSKDYSFPTDETVLIIPSTYKLEEADAIMTALNLWKMPISDDWKAGLWRVYRDRRAVDETYTMIRTPKYGSFRNYMVIPGLEVGDIAWHMWWWDGEPAQLVESVSQNWDSLIADANNIK